MNNIGQANYSASKAALNSLVKTFAKEFRRKELRINAVAPGFVESEMAKDIDIKPYGIQRKGQAFEVANLVKYLVSEQSTYITGQVLTIDGGLSL